jgi:hypothetical protein
MEYVLIDEKVVDPPQRPKRQSSQWKRRAIVSAVALCLLSFLGAKWIPHLFNIRRNRWAPAVPSTSGLDRPASRLPITIHYNLTLSQAWRTPGKPSPFDQIFYIELLTICVIRRRALAPRLRRQLRVPLPNNQRPRRRYRQSPHPQRPAGHRHPALGRGEPPLSYVE